MVCDFQVEIIRRLSLSVRMPDSQLFHSTSRSREVRTRSFALLHARSVFSSTLSLFSVVAECYGIFEVGESLGVREVWVGVGLLVCGLRSWAAFQAPRSWCSWCFCGSPNCSYRRPDLEDSLLDIAGMSVYHGGCKDTSLYCVPPELGYRCSSVGHPLSSVPAVKLWGLAFLVLWRCAQQKIC